LETRIPKQRVKWVEMILGYENNEDVLRWDFGSSAESDELETAGGQADSGKYSRTSCIQNMGRT